MDITKVVDGSKVTFQLAGDLDITTAPELQAAVDEVIDGAESLVIDFEQCPYLSSAGIGVLLKSFKAMKKKAGDFAVVNMNDYIREVLEITGLDALF
ncbi:MAG: STAS domain-containing protein [Lachnospiraceae bacterium]|nr:STAS domain-containing protein [Lachnospiraceae bacterium]